MDRLWAVLLGLLAIGLVVAVPLAMIQAGWGSAGDVIINLLIAVFLLLFAFNAYERARRSWTHGVDAAFPPEYQCPKCGAQFDMRGDYKRHMRSAH